MNIIEVSSVHLRTSITCYLEVEVVTILNCTVCNDVKSWRANPVLMKLEENRNRFPLLFFRLIDK